MQIITQPESAIYRSAASAVSASIANVCARQGYCILGIVGGRSLPALLEHLLPHASTLGRVHVFWLDERIGPEKNYIPLLPHLEELHKRGVQLQWYPLESTHQAAMEVEAHQKMQELTFLGGTPRFDVVVLSIGEDGHIAALFPEHETLRAKHVGYAVDQHAPKPPALRITVTLPLLLTATDAFLFITGEKQHAYQLFLDQTVPPEQCPAKFLAQISQCTVFTSIVDTTAKHL